MGRKSKALKIHIQNLTGSRTTLTSQSQKAHVDYLDITNSEEDDFVLPQPEGGQFK